MGVWQFNDDQARMGLIDAEMWLINTLQGGQQALLRELRIEALRFAHGSVMMPDTNGRVEARRRLFFATDHDGERCRQHGRCNPRPGNTRHSRVPCGYPVIGNFR